VVVEGPQPVVVPELSLALPEDMGLAQVRLVERGRVSQSAAVPLAEPDRAVQAEEAQQVVERLQLLVLLQ
jgi:hypothetical protein